MSQSSDTIIIEGVNVIPMTEETVLMNQRVIISNGKIAKVEPASHPSRSNGQVIPAKDKFLIPGLSEMHYHFRSKQIESDMKLFIANGITTVRNMAAFDGQDHIAIRNKTISGDLPRLNYYTTGPYLTFKDLSSLEKVKEVVKLHESRNYDFLKIADNLPDSIYLKLLEECKNNAIPVIGHSQRDKPLEYSLRMKSVEHIEEFLYLSDATDGRSLYKQNAFELDRSLRVIKTSGVYIGTTLKVFEFINDCLDDKKFETLQKSKLVKYLAESEREDFLTERNDYRKLKDKTFDGVPAAKMFEGHFQWMNKFTKQLSDSEIPLLTGSDTYGMVIVGFSLHQEFELLHKAGIRPYTILHASTVNAARYLETYATEGTITEGKNAILVLLSGNPLEDIRNTKTIEGVFVKGEWFDQKKIQSMLREVEIAFK